MKVAVILGEQTTDYGGGFTIQEDIVKALLQLAPASQHTFAIFCDLEKSAKLVEDAKGIDNIEIVPYPASGIFERISAKFKREFSIFRKLRKFWKRQSRLERVATQEGVEFIWFVSCWAVMVDMPYLTIVWDLQHRLQPWFPEISEAGEWDSREDSFSWFLQRATAVIAGTEVGRKEIERFYQVPAARISVLPHPTPAFALDADIDKSNEILSKYNISGHYIFYPAQFWSHKNHVNLLLALKELDEAYDLDIDLVLVGSDKGNLQYIKKQVQQLGLAKQVKILGFVPQRDLIALYDNAVALTYMTFFGPENLPPLEAFARACPVIASDVMGASEQFGDAAILVDPRKPEQISAAVKSVIDDGQLRKQLVTRGHERARKWTANEFVAGVFCILDDFEPVRRCWE